MPIVQPSFRKSTVRWKQWARMLVALLILAVCLAFVVVSVLFYRSTPLRSQQVYALTKYSHYPIPPIYIRGTGFFHEQDHDDVSSGHDPLQQQEETIDVVEGKSTTVLKDKQQVHKAEPSGLGTKPIAQSDALPSLTTPPNPKQHNSYRPPKSSTTSIQRRRLHSIPGGDLISSSAGRSSEGAPTSLSYESSSAPASPPVRGPPPMGMSGCSPVRDLAQSGVSYNTH